MRGGVTRLAEAALSVGPYAVAAFALVLVVPFVFMRLVLGPRPFAILPRAAMVRFLLLGCLSAAAAVLVNTALDALGVTDRLVADLDRGLPFAEAVVVSFLLAGVVEEAAKLLALRAGAASATSHAALIVGGLLVGVGFGLVENAFNVYDAFLEGAPGAALGVGFVRSFVLLHPVATGLAADGLGRQRYGPSRWRGALWRGFALAVLVHGLWDLAVFWQPEGYWIAQGIAFPWLVWWGGRVVSDRALRLSGRAPGRVARRRPAWVSATLVAFGLVHAQVVVESVAALAAGATPDEPILLYGLALPTWAAPGLAAYNLALSSVGLVGALFAGRRRWGAPLYALGAGVGLVAEVGVMAVSAAAGTLAGAAAELSDDAAAALSGWLVWRAMRRRGRARPRRLVSAPPARTTPAAVGSGASAPAPGR